MSEAMSPSLNRATFALQSRLFVAMKRAGRVIDLVWLQHNADYARVILDTAVRMNDDEVQEIALRLHSLLVDYLAPARGPGLAPAAVPPAATTAPPAPAHAPPPASEPPLLTQPAAAPAPAVAAIDRHLTSLR